MANQYARFRQLETLAEERSKSVSDMQKILQDKGIAVVDGLYDSVLFEAVFAAPPHADGGLSTRTGLGAVQSLVEPLGVRVLVHDCHRSQTLVFRKGTKNVVARWQYISNAIGNISTFHVRGFLQDSGPSHYFLTCFDGPLAWVANRAQLTRTWKRLLERGNDPHDNSVRIPPGAEHSELGNLALRLTENNSKYSLRDAKQLGF